MTPEEGLAALVEQAQQLIRTLAEQAAADKAAFEDGYRLGFGAGVEVGRLQAHREVDRWWHILAEKIRRSANDLTHLELEKRRYPQHSQADLTRLRRWKGAA